MASPKSKELAYDNNWLFPVIINIFLSYCMAFARYHLNKTLGSNKIDKLLTAFPVDLIIDYLTNNNAKTSIFARCSDS